MAASRGSQVDRKPVICWPAPFHGESDAFVAAAAEFDHSRIPADKIGLAEVLNPFGLALQRGIDLNGELKASPREGAKILDGLVAEVQKAAEGALQSGADGLLYRLHGARGKYCSPMQYGGHYLEGDRELLSEFEDACFNLVFVVGGDDVYLDFVSDIPADAFAWDVQTSGMSVQQVRDMRGSAVAAADTAADVFLTYPKPISEVVEINRTYV